MKNKHIILNDWQSSSREENGALRFDRGLYPKGANMISELKSQGMKVGLYVPLRDLIGFEVLHGKTFAAWGVDFICCDETGLSYTPSDPPEIISIGFNQLHGAYTQETVYQLIHGAVYATVKQAGEYMFSITYQKTRREHESFLCAQVNNDRFCVVTIPRSSGWNSPARTHGVVKLQAGENMITYSSVTDYASYIRLRYGVLTAALASYGIQIGEPI